MREAATALRLREGDSTRSRTADAGTGRARARFRELAARKHQERPANAQAPCRARRACHKSFGERRVLSELDLTIPAGQLLAIVGRSGCGKSTLLRLIAGLDRPSGGDDLDRRRSGAVAAAERAAAVSGCEAASLASRSQQCRHRAQRGWRETAAAALADVGLADRANDWPAVLSGGQAQRVALARALVSRPGVLLLDEPFGALDALTRMEMHRLLERIWREHGFTTVLITHDVAEAVALADRVIVIRDGGIALDMPSISLALDARPRTLQPSPCRREFSTRSRS